MVILLTFFGSLMVLIDDPYWHLFVAITSLLVFPLATGVVLMEEKLLSAINPWKWFLMMQDIKADARFYSFLALEILLIAVIYLAFTWELIVFGVFSVLT